MKSILNPPLFASVELVLKRGPVLLLALFVTIANGCKRQTPQVSLTADGSDPAADATLSVMTFNIHFGWDKRNLPNLDRVAGIIKKKQPDIVLLQELDRRTVRSLFTDQIDYLARKTGMELFFQKTIDTYGGDYGIGILSRLPMKEKKGFLLKIPTVASENPYEQRAMQLIKIDTPKGAVYVVNAHLNVYSEYKIEEARVLLEKLSLEVPAKSPVILGGDFNSRRGSKVYQALTKEFVDSRITCKAGSDKSLDHIFSRPALTCLNLEEIDSDASDHSAVVVRWNMAE